MKGKNVKPNRIIQILDLQNNFSRHKQRITRVKNRNTINQLKKTNNSQIDMINSFRKNWVKSSTFKSHEKNRQISQQNKILHQSLRREYNRENKMSSKVRLNKTLDSQSSSRASLHSVALRHYKQTISSQNNRLMAKILTIQSTLSHQKMKAQHTKLKQTRKRLEVFSAKNRQRIRHSLRKMNVQPTMCFPAKSKRNL